MAGSVGRACDFLILEFSPTLGIQINVKKKNLKKIDVKKESKIDVMKQI